MEELKGKTLVELNQMKRNLDKDLKDQADLRRLGYDEPELRRSLRGALKLINKEIASRQKGLL